jgi:hypothetical protein
MTFAEKNKLESGDIDKFLLEVDRLKSRGNLNDYDILISAIRKVM